MKTPINTLLVALCCVSIILAGCNAISPDTDDKPDLPDSDLVGDKKCSPPCWNGIIPGQTSQDTAVLVMQRLNDEIGGKLSVTNYGMSWREKVSGRVYGVHFQDDRVKIIQFIIDGTSLEQVIGLFGEQDYLISGFDKGGGRGILIYYPNKGLAFTVDLKNQKTITKDAPVTYSYFVHPTDIRNEIGIIHGEEWIDEFMTTIHDWKGYGDVVQ